MTQNLIEGFSEFFESEYKGQGASMPDLVANGQNPDYFIISCIDSRSNPATIFRSPPGTFFGFKAMGAIVRPYKKGTALAAALQFALTIMKVPNLIVVGHTQCGAVKALVDNTEDEEIASFMEVAQCCLHQAEEIVSEQSGEESLLRATEEQIVLASVENLKTYPSVSKALEENRLNLRGWLFDMKDGQLLEHDTKENSFLSICNP